MLSIKHTAPDIDINDQRSLYATKESLIPCNQKDACV